ncbi:phosphoserine phosphatase SerB [Ferrovibrio sp.]|uniref:phosphoserine phosphatase SerB n=1 Tax=Ferrovibrio sp. TaxID=1917215 RepID=UPI0025BA83E4|nr:phosphoserine phosphatase SerB [Ferrovibrio sp.]MBX3453076.1 phosphoserine phosphatase SerB [Ferrovibrio sp.]
MQNLLTLIVDPHGSALSERMVGAVRDALALAGAKVAKPDWLDQGIACDIGYERLGREAVIKAAETALRGAPVDLLLVDAENRRKKVLVADMESTIIRNEMIDELAEIANLGPGIADITRRAMNGELNFDTALRERVALLKGLPDDLLDRAGSNIKLMPGASTLLRTLKHHGVYCALVSGGFDHYTRRIQAELGFDEQQANHLVVTFDKLAGTVREPILGRDAKLQAMQRIATQQGVTDADCLTVGDGANDLSMLLAAGMGIAFRAKPNVRAQARLNVRHGDLTALLYAQGYRRADIIGRA